MTDTFLRRAWWRIESWFWRATHWLRRDKGEVVETDECFTPGPTLWPNADGQMVRYVEELPPDLDMLGDNERDRYTLEAPKRDFDLDGQAQALVIAKRTNRPVLTVDGWVVPDVGYGLRSLYGPTEAKNGAPAITMQAEDIMLAAPRPAPFDYLNNPETNAAMAYWHEDVVLESLEQCAPKPPKPEHYPRKPSTKRNRKGKK